MSITPLVSVIMPAYNADKYIATAIQSLLDQSYENWELLLVNDGSIDNTESIVLGFNDSRIRYFKQENKGVSAARNLALANMKGDLFCFLDADDAYPPNSIRDRLLVFQANESVCFVDGKVVLKDDALNTILSERIQNFSGNPRKALIRLDSSCFFGPSWMIRRIPNKIYQFKQGMTHAEDLLFFIENSSEGDYVAIKEEVLYYRVSNSSAMSNLKGLENGYAQLYQEVRKMEDIANSDKTYLRHRIIRIMFLSYLKRKQPLAAVKVLFRYLFL